MGDILRQLAGSAGEDVAKHGDFIFLKSATADIDVIINGQRERMSQGDRRDVSGGFENFRIENTSASANSLRLTVGHGAVSRSEVSGTVTVNEYSGIGTSYDIVTARKYRSALVNLSGGSIADTWMQLENPAGSGFDLYVTGIYFQYPGAGNPGFVMRRLTVPQIPVGTAPAWKKNMAAPAAVAVHGYGIISMGLAGAHRQHQGYCTPYERVELDHSAAPLVINAGESLILIINAVQDFAGGFEWAEI